MLNNGGIVGTAGQVECVIKQYYYQTHHSSLLLKWKKIIYTLLLNHLELQLAING